MTTNEITARMKTAAHRGVAYSVRAIELLPGGFTAEYRVGVPGAPWCALTGIFDDAEAALWQAGEDAVQSIERFQGVQ